MIDPETRFSEDETRQIIARAVRRQEASQRQGQGEDTGLTLHGLQEVTREAGLDPRHVQAAAREVLLRRETPPLRRRLGLPLQLDAQRVIPGAVDDAQWERIVAELRRAFGKHGVGSQFGAVREWISGSDTDSTAIRLRLEPFAGDTLVTLHQPTKTASDTIYALGGTLGGSGALSALMFAVGDFAPSVLILPLLLCVLGLLASLGAWSGYRASMLRQQERFQAVLDRAELIARDG